MNLNDERFFFNFRIAIQMNELPFLSVYNNLFGFDDLNKWSFIELLHEKQGRNQSYLPERDFSDDTDIYEPIINFSAWINRCIIPELTGVGKAD